ncbi:MAG: potassium-transporting ATPase subunit KdpA [Hymenobacter sp.]
MMTNAFYGGVGVGFLNFFVFIIVAVFISGLMVGRTPEFLGKKIEAREMKIAILIALLHPLLDSGWHGAVRPPLRGQPYGLCRLAE